MPGTVLLTIIGISSFFCIISTISFEINCCLLFDLLYQTEVLLRKMWFHLIHFFQKLFHIMYLNFMGASNGEQDCKHVNSETSELCEDELILPTQVSLARCVAVG